MPTTLVKLWIEPICLPPPLLYRHPAKRICASVRTAVYNHLAFLGGEISKNSTNKQHNLDHLLMIKLTEDAMRLWLHWKEETIQLIPPPDFEVFYNKLALSFSVGEAVKKLDLKVNPPLQKSFRWTALQQRGEIQWGKALDEALILLLAFQNEWVEAVICNYRKYTRKPLLLFPRLRLERNYSDSSTTSTSTSPSESKGSSKTGCSS